jgi:hypothetical protein
MLPDDKRDDRNIKYRRSLADTALPKAIKSINRNSAPSFSSACVYYSEQQISTQELLCGF